MEGVVEEDAKTEAHMTSAAAFVEGGIQDACDDACSICLEVFCDSDPSTVTTCKHEYHLQCILEWCQRSAQCPMCWQPISLKDPTSQELLEAVERERSFRFNPSRNATIFRHPTLGDFELQHLPIGVDNAEIEERIIRHLAAAAAMGRARHAARREGHRSRSSTEGHPQFMVFSSHPNTSSLPPAHMPSSPSHRGEGETAPGIVTNLPPSPPNAFGDVSPQLNTQPASSYPGSPLPSESNVLSGNQRGPISSSRSLNQSSPGGQDTAGPSDLQSFSESLKSRLNAVSTRYKESISRSTRSWKEKFFSRNTSMADIGSEVRREVNAGIATVSRMMERLETRENNRSGTASVSTGSESNTPSESSNERRTEGASGHSLNERGVEGTITVGSGSSGTVLQNLHQS
ncbi:PREDICTED: E3 ubiquitin-protein ligase RHF2A isoform X2 [Tarenaya hassleriana]|uniref:E3 ubiquitin-protein ligase RHF2A isoform X2 n=1 Tax=Tarenaya hassleriana TaxID=28532 RepID=UPI00053C50C6|nr:PREDICTED: E3 ubiquitin-protein ligase RHF2A isoform X2 [Tarenaya hassleriana]